MGMLFLSALRWKPLRLVSRCYLVRVSPYTGNDMLELAQQGAVEDQLRDWIKLTIVGCGAETWDGPSS